eukprot:Partr_v1_DN24716_c0_g1_i2_m37405 putative NIPA-like domain containing
MTFAVGLTAALIGNCILGAGQCIQKYALNNLPPRSSSRLSSPVWLVGLMLAYLGEFGNVIAISYASASIVAPLGIISVFANALMASRLLGEKITGRRQREGYLWICLGVGLVLLIAPKPSPKGLSTGIEGIASLTELAVYLYRSQLVNCVLLLFACAAGGLWMIFVRRDERLLVFVGTGASFGAVSMVCLKALMQFFRIYFDPVTELAIAQRSMWAAVPLAVSVVVAVVGQEAMKQLALSRYPVSKLQPQYYAVYNVVVVLASTIVYQELTGGFLSWLLFFAVFAVGIATVVQGAIVIQDDEDSLTYDKRQV